MQNRVEYRKSAAAIIKITKVLQSMSNPRKWLQDDLLRRLFRNAAVLFSGNIAASLMGLVSLTLTARALGVEDFGVLVLITTYIMVVDRLVNFQSWQAVIKYGADALEQKRDQDFKSLVKFGFLIDGATAILGTVIGAFAAWLVGNWRGWDEQVVLMATVYSIVILFHIQGTPTGLLRLFDRFNKVAYQHVIASFIKLLGVSIAFMAGAGLWAYLLVWAVVDILGKLILIYFAWQELEQREFRGILQSKIGGISQKFKGIWSFAWTTNIHSSVKLVLKDVDILLIGAILGNSGAGLYKIVKSIGDQAGKLNSPLSQSIYPELSRMAVNSNLIKMKEFVIQPMKIVFVAYLALILLYYLIGEKAISLLLGPQYIEAYMPGLVYLVGVVIAMATFPFHPILLSLGKAMHSLAVLTISSVCYLIVLYITINKLGIIGASLSYAVFYVVWAILQMIVIWNVGKRIITSE